MWCQGLQKIKIFCHSLFKKPDNCVANWQEVTLSELIQIGNDLKRPPLEVRSWRALPNPTWDLEPAWLLRAKGRKRSMLGASELRRRLINFINCVGLGCLGSALFLQSIVITSILQNGYFRGIEQNPIVLGVEAGLMIFGIIYFVRLYVRFMISPGKADPIVTKQVRENKDTSPPTVGIPPLSMVERLILRLGGEISCGMLQPQGYGPTEFFLKHCSKHGIITTHRQGYLGILRCGQCCEERGKGIAYSAH